MRKLILSFTIIGTLQGHAQTLAIIGTDTVDKSDFLYAYQKNNTGPRSAKSMQDYLDLYIASRLKVKEAKARGLDTSAQFRADLQSLRAQIEPAYLNDPQSLDRLTSEALLRAQTDLRVAHIFIATTPGTDTTAAFRKATEAYQNLQAGTPFETVARKYSDDPAAQGNGGDLGFITVFTLPYGLENVVYTMPVNSNAPLHRTRAGYHIFRVAGKRPAAGRMQAAQILLAFPPAVSAAEKATIRKRADSLYNALQKGARFEMLAERFSHDALSAGAGGLMPEFGIGQFDPQFEQQVFALATDGVVSRPFETAYGIHIVKRVKHIPAVGNPNEADRQQMRLRVQQSDRMESTRTELVRTVQQRAGYQPLPLPMQAALETRTRQEWTGGTPADALPGATPLFNLGSDTVNVDTWLAYARTNRVSPQGVEQTFGQLWEAFVQEEVLGHYRRNLEVYSPDFRRQLAELREGNLFFEIMQQEVWLPAQNDTTALRRFYQQNKERYRWARSADAVVFYAANQNIAQELATKLRVQPARWRSIAQNYPDAVTTDSARMEWSSIPGSATLAFKNGQVGGVVANEADGSATVTLILRTYGQPVQRSFDESKGALINDFQAQKEKEWVEALKKKYPVRMVEPLE